jgi:hypothetical protein
LILRLQMFDYLDFFMQQPKRLEECLVSSHSFSMLALFSTVCNTCSNDLDSPSTSLVLCHCAAHSTTWSAQGPA